MYLRTLPSPDLGAISPYGIQRAAWPLQGRWLHVLAACSVLYVCEPFTGGLLFKRAQQPPHKSLDGCSARAAGVMAPPLFRSTRCPVGLLL